VLVWDASEDLVSEQVVQAFSSSVQYLNVRYFKAERPGLPAQRNDSIEYARGDIIFFIDDDSEVSTNGIRVLSEMFLEDKELDGGCLPLDYGWPTSSNGLDRSGRFSKHVQMAHAYIFNWAFRLSGLQPTMPITSGPVRFLSGCDMALRRSILLDYSFNERLQRFGGYALYEDQLLSRQLHLAGRKMRVANGGMVRHLAAVGNRSTNPCKQGQMEGYNASIVWKETASKISFLSIMAFLWARFGFFLVLFLPCLRWPWQPSRWQRLFGYLSGIWTFVFEEF